MRALIYSDLHLEFPEAQRHFRVPDGLAYDIVILAGDIDIGTRGLYWAAETFPNVPIVYVNGNHEYYGGCISKVAIEQREVVKDFPNIHLLDNSSVVIDGLKFVGSVLWTDFKLFGSDMATYGNSLHHAKNYITDFSVIRTDTGLLTPADTVRMHEECVRYLSSELDKPHDGNVVVVTHHLPSIKCVAEKFKRDLTSAAFASNLDHLVKRSDLWIGAHTHFSFDVNVNDETVQVGWICGQCSERGKYLKMSSTWHDGHCHFCGRDNVGVTSSEDFFLPGRPGKGHIVVNPRGYPMYGGEIENRQFQDDLVVEI